MSANRGRAKPLNTYTISFLAMAMLEQLAEENGMTKSGFVEHLIRRAARADELDRAKLEKRAVVIAKELEEKKAKQTEQQRRRRQREEKRAVVIAKELEDAKRPRPEK